MKNVILTKQTLGKIGEDLAVKFLKKKGYKILDRNFRSSRFGEIDIVAQDNQARINVDYEAKESYQKKTLRGADKCGLLEILNLIKNFCVNQYRICVNQRFGRNADRTIVFVEVKTKSSDLFGSPEDEFTVFKKQKMQRAVQDWFWTKKIESNNWRIDLIAVDFRKDKEKPEIRHYPGYF